MSRMIDEIRAAVSGQRSLIYLQTHEEDRVVEALHQLAKECFDKGKVSVWTCTDGLDSAKGKDAHDPAQALRIIVESPHQGFYVMKDLSGFIERQEVIRGLRDAYHQFSADAQTYVVILSPVRVIPDALDKEMCLVEVPLPDGHELLEHVLKIKESYPKVTLSEAFQSEMSLALRGLILREAGHLMHRVFKTGEPTEAEILTQIFLEKKWLLRKAGYLEFIPQRLDLNMIGGLDVLKEWVAKRRELFTQEAVDADLPVPRGVLIMGISGCGKSMSAKAIASLWRVPLFRLDMNLVFSGMYGTPEEAFHRAMKAIESVAPAVLWIDEIENALGMTSDTVTAEQALTFSSFLTWMQERPPLVFIAATANKIETLPAEIIRKGRFDEVFFCDLPGDEERAAIFRIHLELNKIDPDSIEIHRLLHPTRGWTGAEIEQAVVAARIDALREKREVKFDDLVRHAIRMVPLSTTMAEQIRAIRSWSHNRATLASKAKPKSMVPEK